MPYDERSEPEQLTFSVEGFLASPSHAQESERARRTLDGSGRECLLSLSAFGRHGSSLKTFAACFLSSTAWYSNLCALTWSLRATKSSRLYILLRASARHTSDIAFSLWATPQANDAMNPHQPRLKKDRENRDPRMPGSYRGDLKDTVMFPTPSAQEYGNNQSPSPGAAVRPSLSAMVKMWPTPRSGDSKNNAYQRDHGQVGKERLTLTGAVRMFPTPSASMMTEADMEQARYAGSDPNRPTYAEAKMLPTPRAADANKNIRTEEGQRKERERRKNGEDLNTVIGGTLNPTWVEWLQGFPIAWTDCEPSGTP
jgi:hypothetical protein